MSVNIRSVGSSLERFLSLVVARETRHIGRVTNMNNNVRLKVVNKMSKPLSPAVMVLVMSVTVGNDEMAGQGTTP